MGAQMSRELGVYNEEEKVFTPTGEDCPQRYRLLSNDPRSATVGIKRTPIQVESTPKSSKIIREKQTTINTEHSFTHEEMKPEEMKPEVEEDENNKIIISETVNEVVKTISSELVEEIRASVEVLTVKYMETDIDAVDTPTQNEGSLADREEMAQADAATPLHQLFVDVRSPSLQFSRTPILVECTPELFAMHSHIDSLSLDSRLDDPSIVVSEDDPSSPLHKSTVHNWLNAVDNREFASPNNASFNDSPKTVARKQKELNALKKQLFFTPDATEMPKPKARTPLGDVHNSPQQLIRTKQWRNMKEERKRRGIHDAENTPPNLSPLPKVSSAPGKMLLSKRGQINWDQDNTMLI